TGYTVDEMMGRSILDFIHPEDLAPFRACSKALVKNERRDGVPFAYRLLHRDGHSTWVQGNPTLLRDEAGRPVAVVDVSRDVTAQRALEAELREARDAAEAAAVVKGDFLANMSHELRTPLTSVLGFTRLALEQPELSETSRSFIGKASNAGAALLSTVNDILDFSKLESGQLQIRVEPFDPGPICRDTLELFEQTAADKGVALKFEAVGLPPALSSDPNRLRQILLNLIGNAVKFTEAGAITLSAEYREPEQRLHVSVKDNGPGISSEDQALLFQRFSQVDGSSTRRHGGTGLGLAICLGLVEAMGGEIGVESEPGKGARFFFDIAAPPVEAPGAAADLADELFAPGVRVLVADDHPVNREFVRLVLSPFGAEVTEAANGAEAVDWAGRQPFDIILMDLRMPVLDGMDAMRAIRQGAGPNADVPILAFSAGSDGPGAQMRREAGFDGDLAKPVLPEGLIAAVAQFTGGWDETDDLAASVA
ncbi:MAG TPA: ATP-binding protein, partial [Phenylobacterium sp.]